MGGDSLPAARRPGTFATCTRARKRLNSIRHSPAGTLRGDRALGAMNARETVHRAVSRERCEILESMPPSGASPKKHGEGNSGGFLAFWTTLPGILTGAAALITAIVGLATLVHSWKGSSQNTAAQQTPITVTSPPASTLGSSGSETSARQGTKKGNLPLGRGDEADLERGLVGVSANDDVMFGPEVTPTLHAAGSAFLSPVQSAPSKPICERALSGRQDLSEVIPQLSAPWICVSTSEGHIAYVKIVRSPGVGNSELDLNYAVWY